MAGRIRDEDVALVKERAGIAEVIGERVTLRNAGGGNLKGLCPFHDEKTPSFSVRPSVGRFHCFGCGESGDVIGFVMKLDHLSFAETVERLAAGAGVQLRYEEGGVSPARQHGQRTRLVEAHRAAAEFFLEQLSTAEALPARRFLAERGFDRAAAERFAVGYAPRAEDALLSHLRARGFSVDELRTGGLVRDGRRGPADRFTGRVVWPIRDITGDVVGFGARRLYDDDFMQAKYLNTPETPLYKKSSVLYGLDLAKRDIAREQRAVVVEGYTDVMACHLAGVGTAIATCGTAFGDEHIRALRRVLVDSGDSPGEVVFTFDGDEAGQKAALRAFADDQKFVSQTFVAVEPSGLDPCDLRLKRGDAAVRELVERRVRLFEFVIRHRLARHDLDTPDGRVAALASTAPVVAEIRDRSLRPEYARTLAGWLGMEVAPVLRAVQEASRRGGGDGAWRAGGDATRRPGGGEGTGRARGEGTRRDGEEGRPPAGHPAGAHPPQSRPGHSRPRPDDPSLLVERESLKLALQEPALAGEAYDVLSESCYTAPAYAALHAAVAAAGGTSAATGGERWIEQVAEHCPDDEVRGLVTELAVESMRTAVPDARYAAELLARLEERALEPRIAALRSRLQRLAADDPEQMTTIASLMSLEQQRRQLREQALGGV